jgi:hypothetical protein
VLDQAFAASARANLQEFKGSERGETEPIRRNQIRTEERNQKGTSPREKGEH